MNSYHQPSFQRRWQAEPQHTVERELPQIAGDEFESVTDSV